MSEATPPSTSGGTTGAASKEGAALSRGLAIAALLLLALAAVVRPIGRQVGPALALSLDHPRVAQQVGSPGPLWVIEVEGKRALEPGAAGDERLDPWGNAWRYEASPLGRRVYSIGPDGVDQDGAGDDLPLSRTTARARWCWRVGPWLAVGLGLLALGALALLRVGHGRGATRRRAAVAAWAGAWLLLSSAWSWVVALSIPGDLAPEWLVLPLPASVGATLTAVLWTLCWVLLSDARRGEAERPDALLLRRVGACAATILAVAGATLLLPPSRPASPSPAQGPEASAGGAGASRPGSPVLARFSVSPAPRLSPRDTIELGALGAEAHPLLVASLEHGLDPLPLVVLDSTGGAPALIAAVDDHPARYANLLLRWQDLLRATAGDRLVLRWTASLLARTEALPNVPAVRFGPQSPWCNRLCDHAAKAIEGRYRARGEEALLQAALAAHPGSSFTESMQRWWDAESAAVLAGLPEPAPRVLVWSTRADDSGLSLDGGPAADEVWLDPFLRGASDAPHRFAVLGPLSPGRHTLSAGAGASIEVPLPEAGMCLLSCTPDRGLAREADAAGFWARLCKTLEPAQPPR